MAYSYLYAMILALYKLTKKRELINTLFLPALAAIPDAALSPASLSIYILTPAGGHNRFSFGTLAAPPKTAERRKQAFLRGFTIPARYSVWFIHSDHAQPSPKR